MRLRWFAVMALGQERRTRLSALGGRLIVLPAGAMLLGVALAPSPLWRMFPWLFLSSLLVLTLARRGRPAALLCASLPFVFLGEIAGTAFYQAPSESLLAAAHAPVRLMGKVVERPQDAPDRRVRILALHHVQTSSGTLQGPLGRARVQLFEADPARGCGLGATVQVLVFVDRTPAESAPRFRSDAPHVHRGVGLSARAIGPCVVLQEAAPARGFLQPLGLGAVRPSEALLGAGLLHLAWLSPVYDAGFGWAFVVLLAWGLGGALFRLGLISSRRGCDRAVALTALVVLVGEGLFAGLDPTTLRVRSVLIALLAPMAAGRKDPTPALLASLIVVLAVDPPSFGDRAYQVGFASAIALFRLRPAAVSLLPKETQRYAHAPIALLCLIVGTAPLIVRQVPQVGALSVFASGPLTLWGGLVVAPCAVFGLSPPDAFEAVAQAILRFGHSPLRTPTIPECLLFYGVLAAFASSAGQRAERRFSGLWFALVLFGVTSVVAQLGQRARDDRLELWIFPARAGYAAMIESPKGEITVLASGPLSTGPRERESLVEVALRQKGRARIDTLIVSARSRGLAQRFDVGRRPAWRAGALKISPGALRWNGEQLELEAFGQHVWVGADASKAPPGARVLATYGPPCDAESGSLGEGCGPRVRPRVLRAVIDAQGFRWWPLGS